MDNVSASKYITYGSSSFQYGFCNLWSLDVGNFILSYLTELLCDDSKLKSLQFNAQNASTIPMVPFYYSCNVITGITCIVRCSNNGILRSTFKYTIF